MGHESTYNGHNGRLDCHDDTCGNCSGNEVYNMIVCDRDRNPVTDEDTHTIIVRLPDGEKSTIHLCDTHKKEYDIVVNAWLKG